MELSEYKHKIELHAHTKPVSPCSEIYPADLVRTYKKLGYDAIVITNHFFPEMMYVEDVDKCVERYLSDFQIAKADGEKIGINVILGMEIRFCENMNDYLVYGIDEQFLKESYKYLGLGIDRFYCGMKTQNNVILQAHPFRDRMERADSNSIDGIETFNMHPGHNSRVAFASKYAKEHDFIVSAGTDYHHPGHEGCAAVLAKKVPQTSADVANLLKSRDYLFFVGDNIVLPYTQRNEVK